MNKMEQFFNLLRGGKPFGYMIPFILLFFMVAWFYTKDAKIMTTIEKAFYIILGSGAVAVGHSMKGGK